MQRKIIFIVIVFGLLLTWYLSKSIYKDNIKGSKDFEFYIPSGADYSIVKNLLKEQKVLKNFSSFELVADKMSYPELVKPGRYILESNMSNRELLVMLRRGDQNPLQIVIHNERTKENLAGKVANYLESDSASFLSYFNDDIKLSKYGYNSESMMTAIVPNTYNILWNTSPDQFFQRMLHEKSRFWNSERKEKAKKLGLSEDDVFILASIVEQEITNQAEASRVAGLYLNRLYKNMLLQADPTIKFALKEFDLRRVLDKHLQVDSPYNTYKYKGLPPGPICLPSIKTLDATLNAESHDYIYMCANSDFSGNHQFAETYSQHLRYAKEYREALNRERIYK